MNTSSSVFDRMIGHSRPIWVTLLASTLLLALPFAAALMDGTLGELFQTDQWRVLLLPPVIIVYIMLVSPLMTRMGEQVLEALRPLVPLDDDAFDNMVRKAAHINPVHELLVFGAGFALGILSATASSADAGFSWLGAYWFLAMGLMYGILAWTVYVSVISTRVNAAIHRKPLQFDILDPAPFEAVGRQSLLLALVFVGGITLSLLLSFQIENMTTPAFWLINLLLVLLVVLIFFMNMRPTHQVLAAAKRGELSVVQDHIQRLSRELVNRLDRGQDTGNLPGEINALTLYEERLQAARTWPYNTHMLRTLFFSVLIPVGSLLVRLGFELLFW